MTYNLVPMCGVGISGLTLGFMMARIAHWNDAVGNVFLAVLVLGNLALYLVDRRRRRHELEADLALSDARSRAVADYIHDTHRCPACGQTMEPSIVIDDEPATGAQ